MIEIILNLRLVLGSMVVNLTALKQGTFVKVPAIRTNFLFQCQYDLYIYIYIYRKLI